MAKTKVVVVGLGMVGVAFMSETNSLAVDLG